MNKELRRHDAARGGDAMELSNLRNEVALLRDIYLAVLRCTDERGEGVYGAHKHLAQALWAYDQGNEKEF